MKLGYNTKAKDPTYYIQLGIRNGKKTTTKNIATIGKHSELLAITDDPLAYAKAQVAKYNEAMEKKNQVSMEVLLDFSEKVKSSEKVVSESTRKAVGYFYLAHLYRKLEIQQFFQEKTKDRKFTFSPDLVNRFLTYARILDPDSKLGSLEKMNHFFEEPDFDYQHILRTMDLMAENYDDYIAYLFHASNKVVKRNTAVCYYDCTNYYCEAESADEDYTDPITGEVLTGLRQYGLAKDHKPNPLVEMGLFMDTNGIPISMCITPGNANEQTTVLPLEKELIRMFGDKKNKFIYCADAGLGSYHIRSYNAMGGRAFIVTQSIKKLSNKLKEAVFNDFEYKLLSDETPVSIEAMKQFDKADPKNLALYRDTAYKVIDADTLMDVGLSEEKVFANGKKRNVKSYPKEKLLNILIIKDENIDSLKKKYDYIYSSNNIDNTILLLPRVIDKYKENYNKDVLVGDIGYFNKHKVCITDTSFNVVNSYTVAFLHSLGAERVTLSYELTKKQIEILINAYEERYKAHPNLELVVEGYEEVMISKFSLNKYFNNDKLYLKDRFNNLYKIKEKDNLMIIYNYKKRKDFNLSYYDIGINSLRINKEE
ncbi:MAG: hypothetical protein BHW64_05755 [Candidatus Melainabacteria bacterium LEY3_CP_29_8]|nr:MAG: hypothetical protein BHW64_05755 [Candidatus Melainabacteria bacterium LEY3_CP_29_8]